MKVFTGRSENEYLVVPAGATYRNPPGYNAPPIDKETGKPAAVWSTLAIEEVLEIDIYNPVDENFDLENALAVLETYRRAKVGAGEYNASHEIICLIDWIENLETPVEIHIKHEGRPDHVKYYNN